MKPSPNLNRALAVALWTACAAALALLTRTPPAPVGQPAGSESVRAAAFAPAGATPAGEADWPMSGYDAGRTGGTPFGLPARLAPAWSIHLPVLEPAWADQDRFVGDAVYNPIVVGTHLIVPSSLDDTVTAYDVATGQEAWRFYTGGPIRYSPAAAGGRVFVGSDDGYLYALQAETGDVLWKVKGAPKTRSVLGNGRMIDTWAVRGGPVVAAGKDGRPVVYFAAGLWPFMGVFIHCLDAETGAVVWTNSGDGAEWVVQPHGYPSFAGIAPQGAMVVEGDNLLIPQGRAVPGCYDRFTGTQKYLNMANKFGGDRVIATDVCFLNGDMAFSVADGKPVSAMPDLVTVDRDVAYGATEDGVGRYDLGALSKTGSSRTFLTLTRPPAPAAKVGLPGVEVIIRAGDRLYVGGKGFVAALQLPLADGAPPAWRAAVDGDVHDLVAAAGRLFAVTEEGRVYCFAAPPEGHAGPVATVFAGSLSSPTTAPAPKVDPSAAERIKAVLADSKPTGGYALVVGPRALDLSRELVARTSMEVVIAEPDDDRAQAMRDDLRRAGQYGSQIAVMAGSVPGLKLPPYFATLIVADDPAILRADQGGLDTLYRLLHPYRGRAYLAVEELAHDSVSEWAAGVSGDGRVKVKRVGDLTNITRARGPAGAATANWTHENADAANTRVSKDAMVKAPLGILWYGGSTHDGMLPRHGHGPAPQVVDGRVIVEGVDKVRAIDIYTGRVLWEATIPGVGSFFNITDHQAGANGTGSNIVSMPDGIYVALERSCIRLNPDTGKVVSRFAMPALPDVDPADPSTVWGFLSVEGNALVGGVGSLKSSKTAQIKVPSHVDPEEAAKAATRPAVKAVISNPRPTASHALFALDRHSGKLLWSIKADTEFRHNAICLGGGQLYAIDRKEPAAKSLAKLIKGAAAKPAADDANNAPVGKLRCYDLSDGGEIWQADRDVFGTWLSYSKDNDVLMEAGRLARDTLGDEPKGMRAYDARTGQPLWYDAKAAGPAMIRGKMVLKEDSGADLLTGKPFERPDPLTGIPAEWKWVRLYGCNTPIASQNLLTFRSAAAGYYDLARYGGTGNWGGFRSSCTNNLIVAGGVLVAPDYTRTCTCSYQIQTSLALVNDPDAEEWTYTGTDPTVRDRVRRIGVNFGAPGDRMDDAGTLWLEYPSVGGKSPVVELSTGSDKVEYFRRHSSTVSGDLPWVTASGVRNLRTLRLSLGAAGGEARPYTVRLYFAQPGPAKEGDCVMDVAVQGRVVEKGYDVVKEAGGPDRTEVREVRGVEVAGELHIELTPAKPGSVPFLCGVEVVAEQGGGRAARPDPGDAKSVRAE